MARKDKPYLPLYVQDFMTDEKLNECSAAATGVYIKVMCVMHKSEPYGTILLKQKDKQKDKQIENFALKIAKHISFDLYIILAALEELINEEVLFLENDFLVQKRMYQDGVLSAIRSESGGKGGEATQLKNKVALAKFQPNIQPNSDNEIDNDNEIDFEEKKGGAGERKGTKILKPTRYAGKIKSGINANGTYVKNSEEAEHPC